MGKEEILLSENSESMWLDVIRKMDEVYSDLIGCETDLERKNAELEEARNFISSVVASVSDVLLVCDQQGDIRQVNPAFLSLMQRPEEALLGKPLRDQFARENRDRVAAIIGSGLGENVVSVELRFDTAKGPSDLMAINCSARFNSDGRRAGAVFTGRPIGELRRAYEALHRAHTDLQQAQSRLIEQEKMASLGRLSLAWRMNSTIPSASSMAIFIRWTAIAARSPSISTRCTPERRPRRWRGCGDDTRLTRSSQIWSR